MERIAIIADDLTGASDTGIQFRKYGLETLVIVDYQNIDGGDTGKQVWSVNADTRSLSAAEAYGRVYSVAKKLKALGFKRIYKKLDSTLRGHPGTELEAVMDALVADVAVVVPAFPANGRVMVKGRLRWGSAAAPGIAGTKESDDPQQGSTCDVPGLLQGSMGRQVGSIHLETVRRGEEELARAMEALRQEGKEVLVLDAAEEEDLAAIARACSTLKGEIVIAGAAGLAAHLPAAWGLIPPASPAVLPGGLTLLVAGSRNPVTAGQVQQVLGGCRATLVKVATAAVAAGRGAEEVEKAVAAVQTLLSSEGPALLVVAVDSLWEAGGADNVETEGASPQSKAVAGVLAEIARRVVAGGRVRSLVVTGGDTAVHICRALGARGIDLDTELLPGIPLGRLLGGMADDLPVVTKAGGFGPPDAFVRVVEYLQDPGLAVISGNKRTNLERR
ncbi:four-carbon acid sugar kinase family protein [Thermanaeromonas sp. C210]|uniref:four-carbon acid sugar kinase family protein n=1 Tax=Thermanaeromonas sp. C210 TaxID=2731925 RepID=UPI00155CD88D|nr:four-carbon acid sugar kinase family protein [Thermanaeromonas sp. C210]GFN21701.1 Hrp-dependent type III effector protein [Thermanaeromonas sp. C210]